MVDPNNGGPAPPSPDPPASAPSKPTPSTPAIPEASAAPEPPPESPPFLPEVAPPPPPPIPAVSPRKTGRVDREVDDVDYARELRGERSAGSDVGALLKFFGIAVLVAMAGVLFLFIYCATTFR